MKIATWNLERPRRPQTASKKNNEIRKILNEVDADVWVLTETNECIDLRPDYIGFSSETLLPCKECDYTTGENRTAIWVRKIYAATKEAVFDPSTSVCARVVTAKGPPSKMRLTSNTDVEYREEAA